MRNHNIHNMSPEDKQKWCELGMKYEIDFIENIAPLCNLHLDIHPEKKNGNIYYMDLIDLDSKLPVDLKRQETPFFTAQKNMGLIRNMQSHLIKRIMRIICGTTPTLKLYGG